MGDWSCNNVPVKYGPVDAGADGVVESFAVILTAPVLAYTPVVNTFNVVAAPEGEECLHAVVVLRAC